MKIKEICVHTVFACTQCASHYWMLAMFVNKADQIPILVGLISESRFDCQPGRICLVGEHDNYHL